jgi:hypothetical protein
MRSWFDCLRLAAETTPATISAACSFIRTATSCNRGVLTLVKEQHVEREFPDWSMGFKNLQNVNLEALPGYTDFLDLPLTSEQYIENPSKALQLLFNFKNSMR